MTENEFIRFLDELGIKYDDDKLNKLEKYYEMLIKYNKVMNLTGITEKKQVYLKHFYDSLHVSLIHKGWYIFAKVYLIMGKNK